MFIKKFKAFINENIDNDEKGYVIFDFNNFSASNQDNVTITFTKEKPKDIINLKNERGYFMNFIKDSITVQFYLEINVKNALKRVIVMHRVHSSGKTDHYTILGTFNGKTKINNLKEIDFLHYKELDPIFDTFETYTLDTFIFNIDGPLQNTLDKIKEHNAKIITDKTLKVQQN